MTRDHALAAAIAAALLGMIGCQGATGAPVLTGTRRTAPGGAVLRLSTAPNAVTGGPAEVLEVAFDVGGASTDVGYPIDVEELPDGRIAALDRETVGVELLDPTGRLLGRIGREGDGPGELRAPIGLARAGASLVITGMRSDRALMVLDTSGHPVGHFPPPLAGDWNRATQRFSLTGSDFPWYPAREDVPLRMAGFDDSSVAVLVAANEWTTEPDPTDPTHMPPRWVSVLRVSTRTGRLLATLWTGRTPEARRHQFRADAMPEWEFPAYAPWPRLASGDGWHAIADGGQAEISVVGASALARIEWPPHRIPIDEQVKRTGLDWYVRQMTRYSDSWAAWWDSLGAEGRSAASRDEIARHWWASDGPEVTALLGHGRCLWIAGFAPGDGPTAVGRNWIVVDVARGELLGVVRVPDPWFRLRSAGPTGLFATYRDEEGSSHIVKLALPPELAGCAA